MLGVVWCVVWFVVIRTEKVFLVRSRHQLCHSLSIFLTLSTLFLYYVKYTWMHPYVLKTHSTLSMKLHSNYRLNCIFIRENKPRNLPTNKEKVFFSFIICLPFSSSFHSLAFILSMFVFFSLEFSRFWRRKKSIIFGTTVRRHCWAWPCVVQWSDYEQNIAVNI